MTQPDPDAQRLRWIEQQAGVHDPDPDDPTHYYDEGPDTIDWADR